MLQNNILELTDITELEKLLLINGQMQPVDYAAIKDFPQQDISLFCHKHGIYQIITTELVNFVREQISDNAAIEIGAGNGCLGRALGIPLTDSRMQEQPEIKFYYQMTGQPMVTYPNDTQKFGWLEAIEHFKPQVVVASWVTQLYNAELNEGNALGVDETKFKGIIEKYIHVGNEKTHGSKIILKHFPYRAYKFDWLVSRSLSREQNVIYVVDCK